MQHDNFQKRIVFDLLTLPQGSRVCVRTKYSLSWCSMLSIPFNLICNMTTFRRRNLEDLKRSPDLLNNVKIGHGQLRLIIQTYFVLPYMGMVAILVKYHIYMY